MSTTSPCCWCDPLPCRQALDRSRLQSKLRCSPCIGKKLATDPGILLSFLPSEKPQKRRKRSHTNVSNASITRTSTPPAQSAHVRFRTRKRVHTRLSEKNRTQRLACRNRGRFGWGWYHYSRSVPHVHQHPRAGYQNGKFCRFWGLVGGAPKERRKPSEQRCAYARRCPEASRPRWAA